MIPIQLGDKKVLLVKVPSDAFNIQLSHSLRRADVVDILNSTLVYTFAKDHQGYEHLDGVYIGYNGFKILGTGTADKITSEEAKQVVEYDRYYDGDPPGMGLVYYYRDYPNELIDSCLFNAKESLLSLLASHNLKPEETVILVARDAKE